MMDNADTLLQEQLARLEKGIPLQQVLAELPDESKELASLIVIASVSRQVDHPKLSGQTAQAHQAKIMAAARQRKPFRQLGFWQINRRLSLALAGGFVLIALAIFASLMLPGPVYAQASLIDMNGLVEVAPAVDSDDWHFVASGERVRQGQHVRTYADSSVTLVFGDGSRTVIGPNADLVLTQLNGENSSLQVHLTQYAGLTTHSVIPLRTASSFFQVDTPSGSAKVHGTAFNVDVKADGEALFAVTHGKVSVSLDGKNVLLAAGQSAAILPGQTEVETGYQFSLDGPLSRFSGTHWVMNGFTFETSPTTEIVGTFKSGDSVYVRGRIVNRTLWLADHIEPSLKDRQKFVFTGLIDTMTPIPGIWKIGGREVQVTQETDLATGLKVGDAVEVSLVVLENGDWLAKEIENLENEEEKPTATPRTRTPSRTPSATSTQTATLTPIVTGTVTPNVSGMPATATATFTLTPSATVVPKNDSSRCDNRDQPQPEGLRLAARYAVSYEEIMTWFCKGFGFGEIDLAYSLSRETGQPASQIFSMRSSGMGWGQIKKDLSPQIIPSIPSKGNSENNKPDKTPGPKK